MTNPKVLPTGVEQNAAKALSVADRGYVLELGRNRFEGTGLKHLESRAAFVVVSPDPPAAQARFARSRGWKFRMVSSRETSLAEDLGFRSADGRYRPGVSVLRKERTGAIVRVSKARFGPWDEFCSVFNLFDLLPEGADDWRPRFTYR